MTKLFTGLLFPFFCQAGDINCTDLKEGLFKLKSIDGSIHTIVRTKDKQIENVASTGLISEFDIKWTSDCTYLLFNRKVIKGRDDMPADFKIDTLYNEIIEVSGDSHKTLSFITGYQEKVETILLKLDTSLLYRNISDLEKFKQYNGAIRGGTLIGDNHSVAYRQNSSKKTDFLIAFEEVLLFDHKSKYKLLDHLTYRLNANENIVTSNCRYNDKYDKEIVAIYTTNSDNEEVKIVKAWRFNRLTLRIEDIIMSKVKYKVADKNLFFWDK